MTNFSGKGFFLTNFQLNLKLNEPDMIFRNCKSINI